MPNVAKSNDFFPPFSRILQVSFCWKTSVGIPGPSGDVTLLVASEVRFSDIRNGAGVFFEKRKWRPRTPALQREALTRTSTTLFFFPYIFFYVGKLSRSYLLPEKSPRYISEAGVGGYYNMEQEGAACATTMGISRVWAAVACCVLCVCGGRKGISVGPREEGEWN